MLKWALQYLYAVIYCVTESQKVFLFGTIKTNFTTLDDTIRIFRWKCFRGGSDIHFLNIPLKFIPFLHMMRFSFSRLDLNQLPRKWSIDVDRVGHCDCRSILGVADRDY